MNTSNPRQITRVLPAGILTLCLLCLANGPAWAQNYAAPNGPTVYGTDGDCGDYARPCGLIGAVQDVLDGLGSNEVYIEVPFAGAVLSFEEGTVCIGADMVFDTYMAGDPSANCVAGVIAVDGDIIIESGITLTVAYAMPHP